MDHIHENLEAAQNACNKYCDIIFAAQEKYGVCEECEDSCAEVYIKAKYHDKGGEVKTYYHD